MAADEQVPSDVIVDASMAAAVRDAGKMWTKVWEGGRGRFRNPKDESTFPIHFP